MIKITTEQTKLFYLLFFFLTALSISAQELLLYDGTKLTLEKCLEIAERKEKEGDKKEATRFLNQAASMTWEAKNYSKAIEFYEKSLLLNQDIHNDNAISMINNNLGMIYADERRYEKSLDAFNETLKYRRITHEKLGIISALVNMAVVLNNLNRFDEAARRLEEALQLATETNNVQQMRSCYGMLAETYDKAGNRQKSTEYFNLYRTFHEMEQKTKEARYVQDAENAKLLTKLAESEKKNKELELLDKDRELTQKEQLFDKTTQKLLDNNSKQQLAIQVLNQEKKIQELSTRKDRQLLAAEQQQVEDARKLRNLLLGVFGLILLFSGVLFVNYRQKQKINKQLLATNAEISRQHTEISAQQTEIILQKDALQSAFSEIQKKNEKITSSINYAKLIQTATLPSAEKINSLLPDSFIIYRPKDIVSGDFYWMGEKNNKVVIVAADCTGHGVPGAFMSMVGTNLLNQIVFLTEPEPDLILSKLHTEITRGLNKKETDNKDGMDVALYVIDRQAGKVSVAGAKNPLVYVRNGELTLIKGSRDTIGGHYQEKEVVFTKTVIPLDEQPLYIYIYSDGIQDLFGGEKGEKKFSSKRLHELILANHALPMPEQKVVFDHTLTAWMNGYKQIDDILLIGAVIRA